MTAPSAVQARHLLAAIRSAPHGDPPNGRRVPFGWAAIAITADAAVGLHWPQMDAQALPTHLRVTIAIDIKGTQQVDVRLGSSGRSLGSIRLDNASVFQPVELALSAEQAAAALHEGILLTTPKDQEAVWIFSDGAGLVEGHRPHLLIAGDEPPLLAFRRSFCSLASIQQFGWMEGCVLDGLLDLADAGDDRALTAAQQHLDRYLIGDTLRYESPRGEPIEGRIYGIEAPLPFAAIARLRPQHPSLDLLAPWCQGETDADGVIIDWISTTSEGSYTLGYPLAILATTRGDAALAQRALTQVRLRQQRLFDGKEFWRVVRSDGSRVNRNWARGIAWQLLGAVRTLIVLRDHAEAQALLPEIARMAEWTITSQRDDGLWSVFVDEPTLSADTAGTAGIAAALALGAKHGWFSAKATASAHKALTGLIPHLRSDGFLGGASPSNKAGEEVQRSDYRVLYPMGMGLLAQLIAALGIDTPA